LKDPRMVQVLEKTKKKKPKKGSENRDTIAGEQPVPDVPIGT